MSIRGQLPKFSDVRPKLTVVGVGGAGCNAVNNMIASGLEGVDFVVANTDAQALASSAAEHRLQLGANLTEGLGAGSRPEIGEAAAEEAIEDIRKQVAGSHMVFIAAGMGGGTGTGAASVIARIARELGILTVGVVTKPFLFEGARRMRIAEAGVAELRNFVDTLIVIPNQNLFRIASEKTTFAEAFVMADQVLYSGVACIVDLIIKEGLINLDFADVRTVMSGMGSAMMGTGEATGERRATLAAEEAISNPLIDDVSLRGAKGLLLSITGGANLTLYEVDEAASRVRQEVDPEANIIVGATYDPSLGERVRVSIVASGMSRAGEAERAPPAPADAWIRGTRPAAPQEPPERMQPNTQTRSAPSQQTRQASAPLPSVSATQTPSRERLASVDDMQRRLTEALQFAPRAAAAAPNYGASPPPNGQFAPAPRDDGRSRGKEAWRAAGNVTIEDGPPQLSISHAPPPLPQAYEMPREQTDGFMPAPPSDIRRGANRIPDLNEFPQVGQRAYRAVEGASNERGGSVNDAQMRPSSGAPRRLGLFERLAGRVLGESDSPGRQGAHATSNHIDRTRNNSHSENQHFEPADRPDDLGHDEKQDVEMPMFFNRRR
ncbi:MAG: cell division protein FtsZ [Hyphomicrobium sp.]